jgi:hypothetical protein
MYLQTQSLKLLHQLFSLVRWERLVLPHICARTLLSEADTQRLNGTTNVSLHCVGYTVLTAVLSTVCTGTHHHIVQCKSINISE